jgi:hypothetical protein
LPPKSGKEVKIGPQLFGDSSFPPFVRYMCYMCVWDKGNGGIVYFVESNINNFLVFAPFALAFVNFSMQPFFVLSRASLFVHATDDGVALFSMSLFSFILVWCTPTTISTLLPEC